MQLTKWAHASIWILTFKVIHWPWTKVTQIPHFQTSFSEKPLSRLKSNFIWILHGMRERKFVHMVQVTWPRWPPCPYIVKHETFFFSGTKRRWPWRLICSTEYLSTINFVQKLTGLTLTYFMARSNFVPYAFVWGEGKQFFRNYCSLWYKRW